MAIYLTSGEPPRFGTADQLKHASRVRPLLAQVGLIYVLDMIVQIALSALGFNEGQPEFQRRAFEICEPLFMIFTGYFCGALAFRYVRQFRMTAALVWLCFSAQIIPGFISELTSCPSMLFSDTIGLFSWPELQSDGFAVVYFFTYPTLFCVAYSLGAASGRRQLGIPSGAQK